MSAGAVRVAGGGASISADFAHLAALAQSLDTVAAKAADLLPASVAALADPALISGAVLDPIGAAAVVGQASLLIATASTLVFECEVLATALRVAVTGYSTADDLRGKLAPTIAALTHLQDAVTAGAVQIATGLHNHDYRTVLGGFVTIAERDPALAGVIVDGLSGGLGLFPGGLITPGRSFSLTPAMARGNGSIYSDGVPTLKARPGDPTLDSAGPPRSITDLIRGVSLRDDNTDGGGIDVRTVTTTHPDGTVTRAAIVDLTGTKDWGVTDLKNPNVANLGTNLDGMGNQTTSYELGVLMAMHDACITSDEPVMLVGHSQGGIVAAQLASHLAGSNSFNVTHVVTAGSPIGLANVPSSVTVLSLENSGDVVPELDGVSNPARPNWTTVSVDRGGTGFGQRHSLAGAYLPGAQDADGSSDSSIRDWQEGAGAFLTGDQVTTTSYQVGRRP